MNPIQKGPRDAKILICGESPTVAEAQTRDPFSGGGGLMLSHMLSRAGISMSSCFLTNIVHRPAPEGKFEKFYTKALQMDYVLGVMQLKKDIEEIKPNLVIGLGNGPLLTLTGHKGIDKYRGSIYESSLVKGQKVICTYSHGFALKVYESKAVMEIDFQRCKWDGEFPELRIPIREHALNPPAALQCELVRQMLLAEWLAVDIECLFDERSGKWNLSCVGFSDDSGRSLVLPWSGDLNKHNIRLLVECDAKKVYQNGMFDVSVMRENGLSPQNFAWDTMFAHHCLMAECASGEDEMSILKGGPKRMSILKKGLGFQASIYTREPFYKDDGKVSDAGVNDWQKFWLYNGKDCTTTREIRDVQEKELLAFGSMQSFQTEMSLAEPLMAATRRGLLIDLQYRGELLEYYTTQVARLQDALDQGAGRPINVKSTSANGDMQWLLYDHLKLPVKLNRTTKNPTADKDAINDLAGRYKNPLLHIVLRLREYRDFIERYLSASVGSDSRMRCSFDVTGTKSGRLSSRASLDGTGTNLHTIPVRKKEGAKVRQMFIADPGKVFVTRDYKQGETWFVAYLARCEALIELLNNPSKDIHKETAARIYNIPLEQITFEQRYLAKRTGHGSNYGLTGVRLAPMIEEDAAVTGVSVTVREAQMLIDKYFMLYPEIKETFWAEVKYNIMKTRTLTTPFGRKRAFFGGMRNQNEQETLLRDAYSYIPQSGLGDLGNMATVKCYNEIELGRPDLGAEYLLSVHDSIMMQCDIGKEMEVAALMEECMKIPCTIHGKTFIVPSDCQLGFNWNKRSTDKEGNIINPMGLVDLEKWHPYPQGIQI